MDLESNFPWSRGLRPPTRERVPFHHLGFGTVPSQTFGRAPPRSSTGCWSHRGCSSTTRLSSCPRWRWCPSSGWTGRDQSPWSDRSPVGSTSDFRLYSGALTSEEVAVISALGAGAPTSEHIASFPNPGPSRSVAWPSRLPRSGAARTRF